MDGSRCAGPQNALRTTQPLSLNITHIHITRCGNAARVTAAAVGLLLLTLRMTIKIQHKPLHRFAPCRLDAGDILVRSARVMTRR